MLNITPRAVLRPGGGEIAAGSEAPAGDRPRHSA